MTDPDTITELDVLDREKAELSAFVVCELCCEVTLPAMDMVLDEGSSWLCWSCWHREKAEFEAQLRTERGW